MTQRTKTSIGMTACGMICAAAMLSVGCGQTETAQLSNRQTEVLSEANEASSYAPTRYSRAMTDVALERSPLVGTWMGKAMVNDEALQKELDGLVGEQRNQLIREARTFVSTQMAIDFLATGELETAVEIQPVGQSPIAGQTRGKWKVTEVSQSEVTVETTEIDETGAAKVKQTVYAISSDGNRIVLRPSVSSGLSMCEPLIYLDRQILETPAAAMAQQNEGVIVR